MPQKPLACTSISIRVNKPFYGWIIIPTLEIIESGFRVVVVTTVTDGVDMVQVGGCVIGAVQRIAPGVVDVIGYGSAAGIYDANDITLQIQNIIVGDVIIDQSIGPGNFVIDDVQNIAAPGLADHMTLAFILAVYSLLGQIVKRLGYISFEIIILFAFKRISPVKPS